MDLHLKQTVQELLGALDIEEGKYPLESYLRECCFRPWEKNDKGTAMRGQSYTVRKLLMVSWRDMKRRIKGSLVQWLLMSKDVRKVEKENVGLLVFSIRLSKREKRERKKDKPFDLERRWCVTHWSQGGMS